MIYALAVVVVLLTKLVLIVIASLHYYVLPAFSWCSESSVHTVTRVLGAIPQSRQNIGWNQLELKPVKSR